MAIQKGETLLLKIGAVAGSPVTIAGSRNVSISVNNESVDVTNKDSSGMRTLLEGAGIQSVTITMDGVFDDVAAHDTLRANYLAATIDTYSLFYPNSDTLEGSFLITSFEKSGDHNTAETFTATFESSGSVTYTNN